MASSNINLPEDVLIEILLMLPVKSLVRFRCVSKSWFALLKSHNFINMHLKFSLARDEEKVLIARGIIHFDNKWKYINQLSIHSNDKSLSNLIPNLELHGYNGEYFHFAGSCHGIICFVSFLNDVILLNPAIREFRKLPPSPKRQWWKRRNSMGFGFDPMSNDYKVVNATEFEIRNSSSNFCKAQIYNLGTDSWRELDVVFPCYLLNYDHGLFFNGKFHWRASDDIQEFILYMDISTELFYKFRYPQRVVINKVYNNLLLIKDSLALITHNYHPKEIINIWVMKEYGVEESWSKQYSLGPFSDMVWPLPVWHNEQLLLTRELKIRSELHRLDKEFELVGWDALQNELQKCDVYPFYHAIGVVFYKETLLSITNNTT